MRVLFLVKKRLNYDNGTPDQYCYYNTGLINGSKHIIKYLQSKGFDASLEECVDSNAIDNALFRLKPNVAILEGIWFTPEKLAENHRLHPKVRFYVRLHSKLPFLANEGCAVGWLYDFIKIPNVHIAVNNRDTSRELTELFSTKIEYLPNIYFYECGPIKNYFAKCEKDAIDIGCFGAIRPFKNNFVQAVAAIKFGNILDKKIRFHINTRVEQWGQQVLKNIRSLFANQPNHELVEHEWLDPEIFKKLLLEEIDLSMQVSFTESHNLVIADSVSQGVMPVVSDEIDWLPMMFQVFDYDVDSIALRLRKVWDIRFFAQSAALYALERNSQENSLIWEKFVLTRLACEL